LDSERVFTRYGVDPDDRTQKHIISMHIRLTKKMKVLPPLLRSLSAKAATGPRRRKSCPGKDDNKVAGFDTLYRGSKANVPVSRPEYPTTVASARASEDFCESISI